jgi:hypothetical protein
VIYGKTEKREGKRRGKGKKNVGVRGRTPTPRGVTDKLSPLSLANRNKGVYWRVLSYNCRYFSVAASQVVLKEYYSYGILKKCYGGVYCKCLRF